MMQRVGFYPGSFDPITNGHLDIIHRALALVDRLVIGVGAHHSKSGLFSPSERLSLLKSCAEAEGNQGQIDLVTFDGLVVDAMRDHGARIMIRGLRDTTDYNYEMQMAGMNTTMAEDTQVVFLPASPSVRHIAASLVRQIAVLGGDITPFVPGNVAVAVATKIKERT